MTPTPDPDRTPLITWEGVKAVCHLAFWSAAALLVEWPPLVTLAVLALAALGGWWLAIYVF